MNFTSAILNEIELKFSNGKLFSAMDFKHIKDGDKKQSIILSQLRVRNIIEKVGTVDSGRKGKPPYNSYKLAGTSHQIVEVGNKITLSQWHKYPDLPERNGIYEVMYYDGKKAKVEWTGKWHLPIPYINGWRGIAK